jgi:hypothetical protein
MRDSVVGHGRRWKQAHDKEQEWITIRRRICRPWGKTITFLPVFSLPYSYHSLIARSEALRRFFVEDCSWEQAAPPVKDPHRLPILPPYAAGFSSGFRLTGFSGWARLPACCGSTASAVYRGSRRRVSGFQTTPSQIFSWRTMDPPLHLIYRAPSRRDGRFVSNSWLHKFRALNIPPTHPFFNRL